MGMGRLVSQVRALVTRRRRRAHSLDGADVSRSSGGVLLADDAALSDPDVAKLLKDMAAHRAARTADDAARVLTVSCEFRGETVTVRDMSLDLVPHYSNDIPAARAALRRAQTLEHPNLARVTFATVTAGKRLVIASQRAKETVQDKIDKSRSVNFDETLTHDEALRIAVSVCTAAEYLHAQGVVGVRLRPNSVLVFGDGDYRLGDACLDPLLNGASLAALGSAGSATVGAPPSAMTRSAASAFGTAHSLPPLPSGAAAGGYAAAAAAGSLYGHTYPVGNSVAGSFTAERPEFMAPEELMGEASSPGSDVFAFAMLLWQLLHLRPPWPRDWGPLMLLKHLQQGQRPHMDTTVVGMDSPLRRVLLRCWAADPSARPGFSEVRQMLIVAQQMDAARAARDAGVASELMRQRVHVRSHTVRSSDGSVAVDLEHLADAQQHAAMSIGDEEDEEEEDEPPPAIPPRPAQTLSSRGSGSSSDGSAAHTPSAPPLKSSAADVGAQFRVMHKVLLWDPQEREYLAGVVRRVDVRRGLLQVRPYAARGDVWVPQACAALVRDDLVSLMSRESSSSSSSAGRERTAHAGHTPPAGLAYAA